MTKIINGNVGGAIPPDMDERQQMIEMARLIRSADDITCDSCGATNFINVYKIRRISGLMSGTGRDMVVPVPVYACADCGHVNEKFLKSVGLDRDAESVPDIPEPSTEN